MSTGIKPVTITYDADNIAVLLAAIDDLQWLLQPKNLDMLIMFCGTTHISPSKVEKFIKKSLYAIGETNRDMLVERANDLPPELKAKVYDAYGIIED